MKPAAVHMEKPFDNPFATIPNGYKTLMEYMRVNGLEHTEKDVISWLVRNAAKKMGFPI